MLICHPQFLYNKLLQILSLLEPLIAQGVITNVSNLDLVNGIEFFKSYFTSCYYRLMELNAIIDGGLRDADAGVIYDVLYTRTKYKIFDVQCAMLTKLTYFCYDKVNRNVQLNAMNADGPELSLSQISEIIDETVNGMESKKKKINCWKDLKRRVPEICEGKVEINEECPSLTKDGAQQVAEKFEVFFLHIKLISGIFKTKSYCLF